MTPSNPMCSPVRATLGGAALLALLVVVATPADAAPAMTVLSASPGARLDGGPAACNASLERGARLSAPRGGALTLAAGDLFARAQGASDLRILGDDTLRLEAGALRLVDAREVAGAPVALHTPHLALRGAGLDVEVRVDDEWSRVCVERGEAAVVPSGTSREISLDSGQCVRVGASGRAQRVRAQIRLPLPDARGCVDVAIAAQFTPADVAAPPPSLDLFPLDPDKRTFGPCDDPGSGCGAPPMTVQERPEFSFGGPESPPPGGAEAEMGGLPRFGFGGPESP